MVPMHVRPNDKCIAWMVQATRVKGNAGRKRVRVGRSRRLGVIVVRSSSHRVNSDPRIVVIKDLDPQDHGIKKGMRDTLIPQSWGSKHSDPASVAFASMAGNRPTTYT
jgi:hypothetical protein